MTSTEWFKHRNQKVVAIVEVTQEINTTSLSPAALQWQMNCYHIDLRSTNRRGTRLFSDLLLLQLRITVIIAIHLALECRGAVGDVKELAHPDGPQKRM